MTLVDLLRLGAVTGWGGVLALGARASARLLRGRSRRDDMLWSINAAFGAMTIGYNLRWYVAADSTLIYAGLHVYSILLATLTIAVMRAYRDAEDG